MDKNKLYEELGFVRSQIQVFKDRSDAIDGGKLAKEC